MSQFKRLAHSLLSGYLLLGVNILFTLASVPLALHYLASAEFGLWITTTQMAGYLALLDFGLSGSAARILIDYKDHPETGKYGGVIQTDVLVGLSQAGLILVTGTLLAFFIGPFLKKVPANLQEKLFWLVIGQSCITAVMFVTRIVAHILTANSRFDITNSSAAGGLMANFAVMWWSFARSDGVFSMLWGQAASVVLILALNVTGCFRLKLFPRPGQWGRPSWERFQELFAFGWNISLYSMGLQFVNASQTIILARLVSLDAAALWNVYTRAYILLVQVIGRIFDFSASVLAEMMVRGERQKLLHRFRDIVVVCINLAIVAGTLFAFANTPFVHVWKAGKAFSSTWSRWNDVLLGIWLVISISVRVHSGLVGQTKDFRALRYLYFLEGAVFITLTVLLYRLGGITMMLGVSILCSLCFTFPYGLWRTCQYFGLTVGQLGRWHGSTLLLVAGVVPVVGLTGWMTRHLPASEQLMLACPLGLWAALMFLRYGLADSLRHEASRRAPSWARPLFAKTASSST